MLIKQFRSSYHLQYLFLVVLAAGLWIRPFFTSCDWVNAGPESPLFQLLYAIIPAESLLLAVMGFVLLIFQSLYLNYILIKHEVVSKNTLITAFIYVLVMSQSLPALGLNPVLCAALFVIAALDRILCTYGKPDPTRDVFSAALLLSLASLFYFPAAFFMLILFLSFIVFGTFSLRIFFVAVTGILTVYLYLFFYYFLMDELAGQWCRYINWFAHIPEFNTSMPLIQFGVWAMTLSFFLDAFFFGATRMNEWNIKFRKMILLSIYFVFIGLGSMIYLGNDLEIGVMMMGIPVTIFIAGYLSIKRKVSWFQEIYLLSWYLLILVNNLLTAEC